MKKYFFLNFQRRDLNSYDTYFYITLKKSYKQNHCRAENKSSIEMEMV